MNTKFPSATKSQKTEMQEGEPMAKIQDPPQNPTNGTLNPVYDFRRIEYSRFFNSSLLSSTSPTLRRLSSRCIKKRPSGSWLSASSMASLHLTNDQKPGGIVLIVSLQGEVYEEHYISKLIFSWPQVSCLDNCPVRGSRVVFASYRDSFGQVQKFAMRFSSVSESQSFVHSLKDVIAVGITRSKFAPEIPSAVENISTQATYLRPAEELSNGNPTGNNRPSIPSSFTALLFESCTKGKGRKEPETFYLNNQAMGSLPESSFNAMLMTLEMMIAELGGDLAL